MSVQTMKRILQRVKEKNPNAEYYSFMDLERAIFFEAGTNIATVRRTVKVLKRLGWIRLSAGRKRVYIGEKHEVEA